MIRIKCDKIILPNELFDGYVYVENGKIMDVCTQAIACDTCYDYTGWYLAPGFIDMHTHGAGGSSFLGGNEADVVNACNTHLRYGTTALLPTLSAAPFTNMRESAETIIRAKHSQKAKNHILGVHMEGPYLSDEYCGAQRTAFLGAPKKEEYQPFVEEYAGDILRWTYAPELDTQGEFCRFITKRGVLASAGHSGATYEDMKTAVENGCRLVTHLYSCTSTVTRKQGFRFLGVIESAFLLDELCVELIADGKHLPPELIQMILKIKGAENVVLTTDSLEVAGTNCKEGTASGAAFIVEDGVCKLRDRSAFAGSIATADVLIRTLYRDCGVSLIQAVNMLTQVPAKLLKLNKGELVKGKDADLVVFDDDIAVKSVFVDGKKII